MTSAIMCLVMLSLTASVAINYSSILEIVIMLFQTNVKEKKIDIRK